MPSLKDFRDRIASVKSTRKITSAMKMVAASKLKKAQEQAEASQPYAMKMASILGRLAEDASNSADAPELLIGNGKDQTYLLIVMSADRGLCGGFNSSIFRETRTHIDGLLRQGKDVKLLFVGKKGYDFFKGEYSNLIVDHFPMVEGKRLAYTDADKVAQKTLKMFEAGEFDVCTVVYNSFQSVISQKPTAQQLIPFQFIGSNDNVEETDEASAQYEFEPSETELLEKLLPYNFGIQIFRSMLDSAAGEQAARMTAMDNATKNAGEMISDLTLKYNRARQAYITKELIEIISGAEAL